jgi:uncharacterized membrane protein YphA (DoxX/SURF4 family)
MAAADAERSADFPGVALSAVRLVEIFRLSGAVSAEFHHVLAARLAGIIEIVGSVLLLVGLWTREAAFIMSGEMAVAYFLRRVPGSFYPLVNGGNMESLLSFLFLYFVFAGPGPWSIDAMRAKR